jgi:hypothetical protein
MFSSASQIDSSQEDLVALTAQRLAELNRLREIGLDRAERLNVVSKLLTPVQEYRQLVGANGTIRSYDRIVQAIRQITVLEFELRGLFKAPDRDAPRKLRLVKRDRTRSGASALEAKLNAILDTQIRTDYRRGPLDEVVAGIRETLGVEAPADDPFAPPAEREPPPTANTNRPKIAARIQPARTPESAQEEPAHKAAMLAITRLQGKGFRLPSAKSKRHNRGPPK